MSAGSLSLLIALAGFSALVGYLIKSRKEAWASWAASMPLEDDPPRLTPTPLEPALEEAA